jgi:hypothetical protein
VLPGTVLGNTRTLELPSPPHAGAIGTQVDGIDTAVRNITVSAPDLVHRYGLLYIEVRGEVEGVGWGGVDRTNAFRQTHYEYRYPYVLRIPFGWDGTLVVHRHGTGPITLWEGLEASLGERNFARQFHETADRVVSDAALHPSRRWAFFAVNQTPVAPGGAYNTLMISDDPSLDGTPLHSVLDVPVGRDLALVAKRLMKVLAWRAPRITLGTGHSGGAGANFMLNAGVDHLRGPSPILAGDNHVRPYDPSSAKIYDGFLSWARGGGALVPVDASRGVSAPTVFLEGEVDVGAALTVRQIDEMIAKGVDARKPPLHGAQPAAHRLRARVDVDHGGARLRRRATPAGVVLRRWRRAFATCRGGVARRLACLGQERHGAADLGLSGYGAEPGRDPRSRHARVRAAVRRSGAGVSLRR